jgi:hypothetical protein
MWLNIKSFDQYKNIYKESQEGIVQTFWEHEAGTFYWRKRWDKVQSGGFEKGDIKWFEGGKLNVTENALRPAFEYISVAKRHLYLNPITRTVSGAQSLTVSFMKMYAGLQMYWKARELKKETGFVYTWR